MGKLVPPMDAAVAVAPSLGGQGSRMLVGALWNCWGGDCPNLGTAALPGLSAPCSLVGGIRVLVGVGCLGCFPDCDLKSGTLLGVLLEENPAGTQP